MFRIKIRLFRFSFLIIGVFCLCTQTVCAHSSFLPKTQQAPIEFDFTSEVLITLNTSGVALGHELLWTVNTTGTNYEESAVTCTNGIAFIGSCSTHGEGHDTIFAVNMSSGEILWSAYTGPGYVGPVVDEERVYYGTDSHGYYPDNEYLYAFNRSTGAEKWNLKVYGGIAESLQYDETYLYFASSVGVVYALYKTNGSIHWTYDLGPGVDCVTKPLLKDQMLYIATFEGYDYGQLYALAVSDGHELWHIDLPGGPWDNSITADSLGHIFIAIFGSSTLNAYYESNGSFLWEYHLHANPLSFNAYHNGKVFIADTGGYVYALIVSTGHLLWETKVGGTCDISSPTLSGGLLFIGTRDGPDGAFYALNESTGTILWRYGIGASVTAPPSIVDGMMLCGSDGWNMYAFDVGDGGGDWLFHRYDTLNTAYSPVGLTNWECVQAACTPGQDITTCVVTNAYDHLVHSITLQLPYSANWYTESGELLKENSDSYTLDSLSSQESQTLVITQEPLFQVTIVKPTNGLYLANRKIFSFDIPLVFGSIDIQASIHTLNRFDVDRVEFFIDNKLKGQDTIAPYSWRWNIRSFGDHFVKVVAYQDDVSCSDELIVVKIF